MRIAATRNLSFEFFMTCKLLHPSDLYVVNTICRLVDLFDRPLCKHRRWHLKRHLLLRYCDFVNFGLVFQNTIVAKLFEVITSVVFFLSTDKFLLDLWQLQYFVASKLNVAFVPRKSHRHLNLTVLLYLTLQSLNNCLSNIL